MIRKRAPFLLLFLLIACPLRADMTNALAAHPSAYLALHGSDPVHWQDWGPAALARAKAENKPLFISSGYFACHWCHVMQQESYRDAAIAALLNRYFIPVKVDRELQPALDEYLIEFVQKTRGTAGWPLNVFVTPEGYPLVGLTYAPPEVFQRLLIRLSGAWQTESGELAALARSAAAEMNGAEVAPAVELPADAGTLAERYKGQALGVADDLQGGFGLQNRFPMAPHLTALLSLHDGAPDPGLAAFLRLTLGQMARQGLRDQLAGGFFRYTVDPGWQIPHFEKMLYNQALHVPLYLDAARILNVAEFREVAQDTLDFVIEHMASPRGGYIASFSAVDDHGEEGGSYLWTAEQLRRVLDPPEQGLAGLVWGLEGAPNNEGGYLPVQAMPLDQAARQLGMDAAAAQAMFARIREKMAMARAARGLPADRKPVAAWNGLMLTALARGVEAFGDEYRKPALALRDFVAGRLWDGRSLHRSLDGAKALGTAALEDYAFVARGLWDWAEVAGSEKDRALAVELMSLAWTRFYDRGWHPGEDRLLPAMPAQPALQDAPLPSASAVLIRMTLDVAGRKADEALQKRAQDALAAAYPAVAEAPFSYPGTVLLIADAARKPRRSSSDHGSGREQAR